MIAVPLAVVGLAAVAFPAAADSCPVPPAPPSATATTPGVNRLATTFRAAADNGTQIDGYVAQAFSGTKPGPAVAVPSDATTASVSGVAAGAGWVMKVRAVSSCGNGAWATSPGVTVAGAPSTYASTVLASGPSTYYRLGENENISLGADSALDSSPLGYRDNQGRYQAGALRVDNDRAVGANGYRPGTAHPRLPQDDDARTIEAWVRPTDNSLRHVAGWGTYGRDRAFSLMVGPTSIYVDTYEDGTGFEIRPITDGAWHHVVVTAAGDRVAAYLDGLPLGRQTLDSPMDTRDEYGLSVGGQFYGADWYGGIDETALYPRELSATEVADHFAAGGWSRPNPATRAGIATGADNELVVSWSLPTTATAPPASSYTVTTRSASGEYLSTAVAGTRTSARITGLPGGTAFSATVTPSNAYGDGASVATGGPATPGGSANSYAVQVRAQNPLAYYRLGEPSGLPRGTDSSGRGNTLAYTARRVTAGSLNTDPDKGSVADGSGRLGTSGAPMPEGDASRSVEAWIRPATTDRSTVLAWGVPEAGKAFVVGVQGTDVYVGDGGSTITYPGSRPLADGNWHHLVVTYDGNRLVVYVDGVSRGARSTDGFATLDRGGLVIGDDLDDYYRWNGGLDEIAVYGRVLSPAVVQSHLNVSGHTPPVLSGPVTVTPGANRVTATWPAPVSGDPPSRFTVTALRGTTPVGSVSTAGDTTTAVLGDLPGGVAYTVQVRGTSMYGESAPLTSPAVTPTGAGTTYSGTVRADPPIAYYRFQETGDSRYGADSSGGGQTLLVTGHTMGGEGALPGADQGAKPDGNNGFASAEVAGLAQNDEARTVEAWIRPLDTDTRWLAGWGTEGADNSFQAGVSGPNLVADAGGDRLEFPAGRSLTDGVWHHVVITAEGSSVSAFLDGLPLGARSFAGRLDTGGPRTLRVGSAYDGSGGWSGGLDELAVYTGTRGAAWAAGHFAAGGHDRPGTVGGLTVAPGDRAVTATWTAPPAIPDEVKEYQVTTSRGGTVVDARSVPATDTRAVVPGLPGATAYTVRVTAVNAYGPGAPVTSGPVTPTGSGSTYASVVQAGSPSAYYRLGEASGTVTTADSTGRNAPLTLGAGRTGVDGAVLTDRTDKAAEADGDCCLASGNAVLPKGNASRTVEAWVRPADDRERWLLGWGQAAVGRIFAVGTGNSAVQVSSHGDDISFPAGRRLDDGAWHLVDASYNGGTGEVTVHLDGVPLGTRTFARSTLTTAANSVLWLGAAREGSTVYAGGLDEVAIYPTVLTTAEVRNRLTASGHTAPGAVTGLTVNPRANAVAVAWNVPTTGDTIRRYTVTAYQGPTARNSLVVGPAATTAELTGLTGGTAYTVQVRPVNDYGDGPVTTSAPVTPGGSANTYAGQVLADGPLGYYRLGESTGIGFSADSSGRSRYFTVTGGSLGAPDALPSDPNLAAVADGDPVGTARVANLPIGDARRTLEGWVRPYSGDRRYLAGYGENIGYRGFALGQQGNAVLVDLGGQRMTFTLPHPITDGNWHHLAATFDGTTVAAYLDGQPVGTRAPSFRVSTATDGRLWIGSAANGVDAAYGGIDEIAVYPGALAPSRIAAHFATSGHARPGAPPSVAATAGANRATVTWGPAQGPDGPTAYTVTALRGTSAVNSLTLTASGRSAVLTGLAGGTAYTFRVTASNGYGDGAPGVSGAVTPTGGATTYPTQVLAQNPLAYYRLGDSPGTPYLADSSGGGRSLDAGPVDFGVPGALRNDPDTAASGPANGPFACGRATGLPKGNAARSVEFWARTADGNARWAIDWGKPAAGQGFALGLSGNSVYVDPWSDQRVFDAGKNLADDAWHHVAVTYDSTTIRVYVDGTALPGQTFTSPLHTVAEGEARLCLGSANNDSVSFNGGLDEISVYGTVLTPAQITAHYTSGR